MKTTYTKLKNGDWGLRVEGQVAKGHKVTVLTKGGKPKRETVGEILWNNGTVMLCTIDQEARYGHCICRERGCCRPRCLCEPHCVCVGGNVFDCLG